MDEFVLFVQFLSTVSMAGIIWFVQIVHYPLFGMIGPETFAEYERRHRQRTTTVVAPLMVLEAASALYLVFSRPVGLAGWLPLAGLVLLALVWGATFFLQVPAHNKLASGFERSVHRHLVRSNWLRTSFWSARGILVGVMCWQVMCVSQ